MNNFTAVTRGKSLVSLSAALSIACVLVGFTHAVSASTTGTVSGRLTYYGVNKPGDSPPPTVKTGACGIDPRSVGNNFIALNAPQFDTEGLCNKTINVRGVRETDGNVEGVIVDRCESCNYGDLDMSLPAAQAVCPDIEEKGHCAIKWDIDTGSAEPSPKSGGQTPTQPESPAKIEPSVKPEYTPTQPESPAKTEPSVKPEHTPAQPESPAKTEPPAQPSPKPQVQPVADKPTPVTSPTTPHAPESTPVLQGCTSDAIPVKQPQLPVPEVAPVPFCPLGETEVSDRYIPHT